MGGGAGPDDMDARPVGQPEVAEQHVEATGGDKGKPGLHVARQRNHGDIVGTGQRCRQSIDRRRIVLDDGDTDHCFASWQHRQSRGGSARINSAYYRLSSNRLCPEFMG